MSSAACIIGRGLSRLLAPRVSTQQTVATTPRWNAFSKYDHFKQLLSTEMFTQSEIRPPVRSCRASKVCGERHVMMAVVRKLNDIKH